MSKSKFQIPQEFQDQLQYAEVSDTRSDAEILEALTKHNPVTSEKNIWAFWHSGINTMPGWCQRNVIDWVRINGPTWTVRILDNVPESPNYALKYLPKDTLPEAFVSGTMDGPYVGPHSADFLRGACLFLHGGAYMDVGNILIRSLDRICWNQLEDPASPYQIAVPLMYETTIANHFVASRKGDPFIKQWHELFIYLWQNRKNHVGLIESPLVSFGKEISFDDSRRSNFKWDFKVEAQTVMEYITQVLCWTRLCLLEDAGDGFSGADYWSQHVLTFDVLPENWGAEATLGFAELGQKMLDIFALPLNADPESEDYKDAYKLVWRLLTNSSMQKITHGKGLTTSTMLGVLWDMPENEGKDCAEGTFGELFRYGTVHFKQTRESIELLQAQRPPKTMKKGVFEA